MLKNLIPLLEKAYAPILNLTMAILAARLYGIDTVGNLALVYAFSALGPFLISRGTDQNIQIIFASCRSELLGQAVVEEIRKRIIRFSISFFLLLTIYLLISIFLDLDLAIFLMLSGIAFGAISACAMPNEIRLIVKQDFNSLVKLKYLSGIFSALIGLILYSILSNGIIVLVGILAIEKTIYLILTIITTRKLAYLNRQLFKPIKTPRINIHVVLSAIAIFSYSKLDQVYIYEALSSDELGVYFATVKIFEIANLLILAMLTSQLHLMADQRQKSSLVLLIEKRLLALSLFIVILLVIAAPLVLHLIFDIRVESYSFIYFLGIGTFLAMIGAIKGPWVAKNNRFKFNTYFTVTGGLFAVACLILFKPISLEGVAITVAFGQLIVNVLFPLIIKTERVYLISLFKWYKK
jgi:O-antigen/teichoic acid export membrane protein